MSEFIRLDQHGHLAAEDEKAQKRLADRPGRYYVAPTSPDLLMCIRAPCLGGRASQPRVVLTGDLSGIALAEFVGFMNQSRITGVLRVVTPSGERAIVFKTGEVRGAASDDPADRLGEIASRLGLVDRRTVEQLMAKKPHPGRVGRLLVEAGHLQPHDLWRCVQHQVSEIFHAILLAREGAFMLVDQPVDDRGATLPMNTQGLLMDSVRRIDEMAEFRKRIPHSQLFIAQKKPADDELEPEERAVYDLCNGARTVAELGQGARLTEFDVTKIVHHLLSGGYVAKSETAVGAAGGRKVVEAASVITVFNGIFREIVGEIRKQGAAIEFVAAANNALIGQAAKTPVLDRLRFAPDGSLDPEVVLANAAQVREGAGEQARALKAALSELMFFLLFQAGDLLDAKADEDLARRVKEHLAAIEQEW